MKKFVIGVDIIFAAPKKIVILRRKKNNSIHHKVKEKGAKSAT
jgi:hypothetical protein